MQAPPMLPPAKRGIPWWVWVLIVGSLCLFCAIPAAILYPVFAKARPAAQITSALVEMKSNAFGLLLYAGDHDDRLPPAAAWGSLSEEYRTGQGNPIVLKNASGSLLRPTFNMSLSKTLTSAVDDPQLTVMLFLSTKTQSNPIGGSGDLSSFERDRTMIAAVDGSSRVVAREDALRLAWEPSPEEEAPKP